MNTQILAEILATEDNTEELEKILIDIDYQGLSNEEAHFILSNDTNTSSFYLLSAAAFYYLGEYQNAIQSLDKLKGDNAFAMVLRACMYREGQGTANHQPDYAQAILWCDKAIEHRNAEAMALRAYMYRNGQGTANHQPDYAQAILWLDKAIEHGNTEAMLARAYMYKKGQGTVNHQPDYAQAILWCDKAIEHGNAEAMVVRAYIYINGRGTVNHQPDYAQAILWLDKAIERGNAEAMVTRACMYINGLGATSYSSAMASYSSAMELIVRMLDIKGSEYTSHARKLLDELIEKDCFDAKNFLFNNIYVSNGYFTQDKTAAFDLFQKHPVEHFIAFCQACIQKIKMQDLNEQTHQTQIECINELFERIPKKKSASAHPAINRFLAYSALFISQDIPASYAYFREVPEMYLSADDFFELSNMTWFKQAKHHHKDKAIALALEFAEYAKKKALNDKAIISLNSVLSKLYLKLDDFSQNISAFQALHLHARKPILSSGDQHLTLLRRYQNYLLLKDEFEPRAPTQTSAFWSSIDKSKYVKDAVAILISGLEQDGDAFEELLDKSDIKHARQMDVSFDGVINKVIELIRRPFLPEQDLQHSLVR